jgi:hypothetical protein
MPMRPWWEASHALGDAPAMRCRGVNFDQWVKAATDAATSGGRLLALWGTPESDDSSVIVRAALLTDLGVLVLELPPLRDGDRYPGLQEIFPAASRMQRAAFDLLGARSDDIDERPWYRHAAWPANTFPLRTGAAFPQPPAAVADDYEFVRVEGDGVHEIPVGPVHAGTIEPGHFRFSVVGEKVLRLEERLGYAHKGTERRFSGLHAFAAIFGRVQPMVFGETTARRLPHPPALLPVFTHLAIVLLLGLYIPPYLADWYRAAARLIGGQ